jgi:hypothetical protein
MKIFKISFLFFFLFFFIGCARGSDPVNQVPAENIYLEITLQVKGKIDINSSYIVIFDTDNDSGDGPFIDPNNNWSNSWSYYVKIINSEFWLYRRISSETSVAEKIFQISNWKIENNTLNFSFPLKELGEPNSVDVNFFVYKNDETPVDALGEGYQSGNYLNFKIISGNYREETDPEDYPDDANLDVILFKIREKRI